MKKRTKTASDYIRTRNHYYRNAEELVGKKEFRKASEMLWGAVTQTLKALAALRGFEIRNHNEFFAITEKLSKEVKDPAIYYTFADLNALHTNFYDEIIPDGAFPDFFAKAKAYIERLQRIIHDVLEEENRKHNDKQEIKSS
jgi:hypothetical protein